MKVEEIEKELRIYRGKGFKWRRTGMNIDRCIIFTPKYSINGEDIPNLQEKYEDLSDKQIPFTAEQIEEIEILSLVNLLYDSKTSEELWNSEYFN